MLDDKIGKTIKGLTLAACLTFLARDMPAQNRSYKGAPTEMPSSQIFQDLFDNEEKSDIDMKNPQFMFVTYNPHVFREFNLENAEKRINSENKMYEPDNLNFNTLFDWGYFFYDNTTSTLDIFLETGINNYLGENDVDIRFKGNSKRLGGDLQLLDKDLGDFRIKANLRYGAFGSGSFNKKGDLSETSLKGKANEKDKDGYSGKAELILSIQF